MSSRPGVTRWPLVVAACVIASGLLLRTHQLGRTPLWVDEAESAINAMTILESGLPRDTYQGNPIYENTLVRPWPDHPEYEFKDVSYSEQGLAVYHAWLPLYAIAGGLRAFGLEPEAPRTTAHTDLDLMRAKTVAPRLPGLLFSLIFMISVFLGGRLLGGPSAAWAGLVGAACSSPLVWLGVQARYYSATLAFSAAVAASLLAVVKHGTLKAYAWTTVSFVLLFYTHLLSFAVMGAMGLVCAPWILKHARALRRCVGLSVVVAAACVPWLHFSGFLTSRVDLPSAWPLLRLPDDIVDYVASKWPYLVFVAGMLLLLALRNRFPTIGRAVYRARGGYAFLIAWAVIAGGAFLTCMPAASFFVGRLSLVLHVPVVLGMGLVLGELATALAPRRAPLCAAAAMLAFLFASGRLQPLPGRVLVEDTYAPASLMNELPVGENTRWYATPNLHLVLTWYTGIPVQSIAPIRKSFLDSHPGDIVLIGRGGLPPTGEAPLSRAGIERSAAASGIELSRAQAIMWARRLSTRIDRERLAPRVARVEPPLTLLPEWVKKAVDHQRALDAKVLDEWCAFHERTPILRDCGLRHPEDWWPIFFYRFCDLDDRRGENLNYAARQKTGTAYLKPGSGWTVTHMPALRTH